MFVFPAPPPLVRPAIVMVGDRSLVAPVPPDQLIPSVPPSPEIGETASPDEAAIANAMLDGIAVKVRDTAKMGHAVRDAHPKAHGCVKARFRILDTLPDRLRVGLFAIPHDYQAWIRFSNGSTTAQADDIGDVRGMAIKVMGVSASASTTQDFVMANGPAFFVRSLSDYVSFTTSPLWRFFVPDWNPFHVRWRELLNLRASTKQTVRDPLDIRYWSQTPYLFGSTVFKFSARPSDPAVVGDAGTSPDRLREAMKAHLAKASARFEFLVQQRTKPTTMPIEDSSIEWSDTDAPFVPVAAITIPLQNFDSEDQRSFCDALSFTPWHGLAAHRPLGGINRVRRTIYNGISRLRHDINKTPAREPIGF